MRSKRLLWQLYPSYLLITLAALVAITWYASSSFREISIERSVKDLEIRGQLVLHQYIRYLDFNDTIHVQQLCSTLLEMSGTRFTVILPSGKVIGDSDEDPAVMDNHADRPEVIQAMKTGRGQAIRHSFTLGQNMLYVAMPIEDAGHILGILRMSLPITAIEEALSRVHNRIAIGSLIVAILAAGMSLLVSRRISSLLEVMRGGAERFAAGDLTYKMPVSHIRELGELAKTMNQMAAQLHERMRAVVRQRNEQEAILAGMVEGVLAIDTEARIITINRAAVELFDLDPEAAMGRTIHEAIRNPALLEFVNRLLTSRESIEDEIVQFDKEEKYLQIHGAMLSGVENVDLGAVIVLNDVTRIRRLESVRREFVANVSHELKTPVTSIKGFVETLLDESPKDEETTRRFLTIIARHADRLHAIIEDLLSLSRLEQETGEAQAVKEQISVYSLLDAVVQACDLKAADRNITLKINCPETLRAMLNGPLMEQAIINLIDNAVKYSDDGDEIVVAAKTTDTELILSVTDSGAGIPKEHQARLFERFYRVEKARSRKLGGTGLGLAIVKHIAQLHGGYPSVVSSPGQGSTFSLHLPLT